MIPWWWQPEPVWYVVLVVAIAVVAGYLIVFI